MDIRGQIETLEANGQLDTADTMETMLEVVEAVREYIYPTSVNSGLAASQWLIGALAKLDKELG